MNAWIIALISIGVIIILAIVGLSICQLLYSKTNHYKNSMQERILLDKGSRKVDIINTGSSFARYGIDYNALGINGVNIALSPQNLREDQAMLKHYSKFLNEGSIILLVVSDLAFCVDKYKSVQSKWKHLRILKPNEMYNWSLIDWIRARFFPVTLDWKNFFRFKRDVRTDKSFELKVNENDSEAVSGDAYSRVQNWCKEFDLNDTIDANQAEKFKETFLTTQHTLSETIKWCIESGYRPVLVNLPVSGQLRSCFSKAFLNEFYYNNINKANTAGVPFIDLSEKKELEDYFLYIDSARLNKVGRKIITKILIKELEDIGYVK